MKSERNGDHQINQAIQSVLDRAFMISITVLRLALSLTDE